MAEKLRRNRSATHPPVQACEDGFTLIELLTVMIILAILAAIAVPAYLSFGARAANTSAEANLRSAIPAVEAYAADNIGAKGDADNKANTTGYKGMKPAILRARYDAGLAANLTVVSGKTNATQYCLTDTEGPSIWSILGPAPVTFHNNAKCK